VAAVLSGILGVLRLVGLGISSGHGDMGLFERLASLATTPITLAAAVRILLRDGRLSLRSSSRGR
jgi:hypothetical protein